MAPPPVPSLNLKKLGVTPNPEAGRARFDPFGTSGEWSVPQEIARQHTTSKGDKAGKGETAGKREEGERGRGGEKREKTTLTTVKKAKENPTRASVAQTGQPHEPNVAKGGGGSLKSKPAGQPHEPNATKGRRKNEANEQLKASGSSAAAQRNATTGGETKNTEKKTAAPRSAAVPKGDAMEPKTVKAKAPVVPEAHRMEAPPSRPRDSVATLLGGAGASNNANAGAKAPRGRQSRKEMEGELVPALPSEAERRKAASAARDPGRRQAVATVPSAKGKSLWGSSYIGLSHSTHVA